MLYGFAFRMAGVYFKFYVGLRVYFRISSQMAWLGAPLSDLSTRQMVSYWYRLNQ